MSCSASRSFPQGEIRSMEGLPVVNPHAAGADIGAEQIFVCIPGPEHTQIVRTFGPYTADLHALADWLVENGIQTIAMESTGVYWIPLFEVLEQRGIHCCLISGNVARRLPARHKTDVLDCQWLQTLHSLGLLTASFRLDADLIALRTLQAGCLAPSAMQEECSRDRPGPDRHLAGRASLCPSAGPGTL